MIKKIILFLLISAGFLIGQTRYYAPVPIENPGGTPIRNATVIAYPTGTTSNGITLTYATGSQYYTTTEPSTQAYDFYINNILYITGINWGPLPADSYSQTQVRSIISDSLLNADGATLELTDSGRTIKIADIDSFKTQGSDTLKIVHTPEGGAQVTITLHNSIPADPTRHWGRWRGAPNGGQWTNTNGVGDISRGEDIGGANLTPYGTFDEWSFHTGKKDSLRGHWKFINGSLSDVSGNGNHLRATPSFSVADRDTLGAVNYGITAFTLKNQPDYSFLYALDRKDDFDIGTSADFTIKARFTTPSSFGFTHIIAKKDDGTAIGWDWQLRDTGKLRLVMYDGTNKFYIETTAALTSDSNYTAVVAIDHSSTAGCKIYLDSTSVATTTSGNPALITDLSDDNVVRIAYSFKHLAPTDFVIDELSFHRELLPADSIIKDLHLPDGWDFFNTFNASLDTISWNTTDSLSTSGNSLRLSSGTGGADTLFSKDSYTLQDGILYNFQAQVHTFSGDPRFTIGSRGVSLWPFQINTIAAEEYGWSDVPSGYSYQLNKVFYGDGGDHQIMISFNTNLAPVGLHDFTVDNIVLKSLTGTYSASYLWHNSDLWPAIGWVFNNNESGIRIADELGDDPDIGLRDQTFDGWFRVGVKSENSWIIAKGDSTLSDGYGLIVNNSGQLAGYINFGGTIVSARGTTVVTDSTWHHFTWAMGS
jgi:hypothetical protein